MYLGTVDEANTTNNWSIGEFGLLKRCAYVRCCFSLVHMLLPFLVRGFLLDSFSESRFTGTVLRGVTKLNDRGS